MAFNPNLLITRQPIVDRNREIAFQWLDVADAEQDTITPFMLRLANIETPQTVYFLPITWVQDAVLLRKLAKDMVLVSSAAEITEPIVENARQSGFRIAVVLDEGDARQAGGDFAITRWGAPVTPSPDTILTGIDTPDDEVGAKATRAMYYSGRYLMPAKPTAGGKRINPDHTLILELMTAVQQEAEPRVIEALFKRDVTLAFKLLRYINSPWFGLMARVESVRHALSIIGYQQLLKWLTLLAVTAERNASPALTHSALVRAKLMELVGGKLLDKRDADNLSITGMLSLLDHLMGVPLEDILKYVNLPPAITEALLGQEGRYARFLHLALACEGQPLTEEVELADIDIKAVNTAHLEAIEWATQAANTATT